MREASYKRVELKGEIEAMELELGLAPPNAHPSSSLAGISGGCGEFVVGLLGGGVSSRKRLFGDAFGTGNDKKAAATLPLFVRDDGEDGDGDDSDGVGRETANKRKRLVGWPPVKCAYRRTCGGGSGYVKVKMEGVAIGRKVDVSLHASYEDLLRTLARMFPTSSAASNDGGAEEEVAAQHQQERARGHGHHHHYVVTYEDGEGDWLLVGDVPWEAFAKSVKRLKISSRS